MKEAEIKTNFHKLIDSIENEELLSNFYNILRQRKNSSTGKLWDSLTQSQQNEVLLSDKESENENNLLSHKNVMKKHKKWLGK